MELCFSTESETTDASAGVLLILPSAYLTPNRARQTASGVSRTLRSAVLSAELPSATQVWSCVNDLAEQLEKHDAKRLTVLGVGRGSELAQALAIQAPKLVRRVILVDGSTRSNPSGVSKVIDWLEQFLPLGLPLRSLSRTFDSRPLLHRLRCPTLVLTSSLATPYQKLQAVLLTRKIPNAWRGELNGMPFDAASQLNPLLTKEIVAFLRVPTKRPQKNRGRE